MAFLELKMLFWWNDRQADFQSFITLFRQKLNMGEFLFTQARWQLAMAFLFQAWTRAYQWGELLPDEDGEDNPLHS